MYSARARRRKRLDRSGAARYDAGMPDAPVRGEDPRRADAPAASPHLASPAPTARPPRSTAPLAGGAVAALVIVAGLVAWGLAPRGATVTLAGGDRGQVLDPLKPHADAQTGEQVAPFDGFALSIDTEPAGAVVTVAGVARGEAPVLAGLDCAPGERVEIAAEKPGFPPARTSTTCRRDALVKLTVRLRR